MAKTKRSIEYGIILVYTSATSVNTDTAVKIDTFKSPLIRAVWGRNTVHNKIRSMGISRAIRYSVSRF